MPSIDARVRRALAGTNRLEQPSLHSIALQVAWATSYANPVPLNNKHEQWPHYFAYSEWFRHRICHRIGVSLDTPWEKLYRRLGVFVEEAYETKEEYKEATELGENTFLDDELAPLMFREFEEIKYQITHRL